MKHYLGICLVLLTVALITVGGLYSCAALADRTVDHVVAAFGQVLQVRPEVKVNQRVVFTQTAPIAELAVVTKEETVSLEFDTDYEILSHSIPLTQKKLMAQAVYRIKAGFDLRQPFSVTIDPKTHLIHATMPPAKILSVEQVGDLSFQGEDAWLNKVTDAERTTILNNLHTAATTQAESSGLKEDAQKQVQDRLQELLHNNGEQMEMDWATSPIGTIR
jgi:hypothetical protein